MKLVELEIREHAWLRLRCGCGESAGHVRQDLRRLVDVGGEFGLWRLDGHVFGESVVYEPAVAAASVVVAALADEVSVAGRESICQLLLHICAAEKQASDAAIAGRDLVSECAAVVRTGLRTLYSEVFACRSIVAASYAFDVIALIDEDEARVERCRVVAGNWLAADLRPQ